MVVRFYILSDFHISQALKGLNKYASYNSNCSKRTDTQIIFLTGLRELIRKV